MRKSVKILAYLAKRAFADGAVKLEVKEVDLAVKVDGVCTAAANATHA